MKSEKSKKTAKDYYVDPDEMWGELSSFYDLIASSESPEDEMMSPELGKMIDDIATKLGFMMKFINYSYKDEMIGDARLKMVKAVYDKNFTLWKDAPCTEKREEGDRKYVITYLTSKDDWDDKRTYLKDWDKIRKRKNPIMINDPQWDDDEKAPPKIELLTPEGELTYHTITVRNNPFSYFTKIAYHAFVNRIKKEKKVGEVLHAYQEKVYEDIYASGSGWENVKRQKSEEEDDYYSDSDGISDADFYKIENEI